MITHLAHLPTVHIRGIRLGMPIAECGFDVGCEVAVTWNPRFVDCKVCLEILFDQMIRPLNIPVIPGPLPQRIPMRAATPPEIDHLDTPIEFVHERPRASWRRKVLDVGVAIVAGVLLMAAAAAIGAITDTYHRPTHAVITPTPIPTPYGTPAVGFTTMPAAPR